MPEDEPLARARALPSSMYFRIAASSSPSQSSCPSGAEGSILLLLGHFGALDQCRVVLGRCRHGRQTVGILFL